MTQSQREALLDLLNLAILTDAHISLKEEDELHAAIEALGWESTRPREIFLLNSMRHARNATDSAEAISAFVSAKAQSFATADEQNAALAALSSLLAADGLAADESAFLSQFKAAFA